MVGPKKSRWLSEFVNLRLHPLGPVVIVLLILVESGKRNSLSYLDSESVARLPIEFIDEIQHFDVDLYAQLFAPVAQIVEELGILADEVHWHHIAFVLYRLGDESLFPLQVANLVMSLPARADRKSVV